MSGDHLRDCGPTYIPPTPPRGEPMPQTREYWEKRAHYDKQVILQQRGKIAAQQIKINQLQQKLRSNSRGEY